MKKKYILLIVILFIISAIAYFFTAKLYPIVLVNYKPVSAGEFEENYRIAYHYYKQTGQEDSAKFQNDLRVAVLDKLIENKLIDSELQRRINSGDLQTIIQSKIDQSLKDADISKGVEILYGTSLDEFKNTILLTQAKQEILEGRLIFENKNLADWLANTRAQAKVVILAPGFGWNGKEVTGK